jgi:hypothetical protein
MERRGSSPRASSVPVDGPHTAPQAHQGSRIRPHSSLLPPSASETPIAPSRLSRLRQESGSKTRKNEHVHRGSSAFTLSGISRFRRTLHGTSGQSPPRSQVSLISHSSASRDNTPGKEQLISRKFARTKTASTFVVELRKNNARK